MPAKDPNNFLNQLPATLYQQLQTYQQSQGLDSLSAALIEALQAYFSLVNPQQAPVNPDARRLEQLEKQVHNLTREVVFLRQELSQNGDRLREQLATVRLSHSGLLQNLRDRIEVLEQTASLSATEAEPGLATADPGAVEADPLKASEAAEPLM